MKPYNKRRIFTRAHYLTRTRFISLSDALKQVWKEQKEFRLNEAKEADFWPTYETNIQSDFSSYYTNQPAGTYTGD